MRQIAPKQGRTKHIFGILIFIILVSILFWRVTTVWAIGAIDYDVTLSPTVVETGELVTYEFSSSCSGLSGDCEDFTITVDYDETVFEFVGFSIDSADNDATVTDDGSQFEVNEPAYDDGDGFTATVTLRVRRDLTTGNAAVPTSITASVDPTGSTINGTTSLPDIQVLDPNPLYDVRKNQVLPPPSINPAFNDGTNGAFVAYDVQYCATQSTGVTPISNAVLVDRLPDGVNLLEFSGADIVTQTSPPAAVSGTFLVWDIGDMDGASGCITRRVEYEFPSSAMFDENSNGTTTPSTTNTVYGEYNGRPTEYGVCVTDCFAPFEESPELDVAFGQPDLFKTIRDDRPLAFPGNNVFRFRFETPALNVNMQDVTIGDTLPAGVDAYEITSGTWPDNLPATLRVIFDNGDVDEFDVDGTGATITYGTATTDGTASAVNVLPSSPPPTATGRVVTGPPNNRIERVELVFPDVPQAFSMSNATVRYTVDTDSGITGEVTQQNCIQASYLSPPNPTPSGTPEGCEDAVLTNTPSSVVNWGKESSTNSVDNTDGTDDFIDFTLTLELDQQASNSLTGDLSYTDTLPSVLDFVAQNETSYDAGEIPFTFNTVGLVGGDVLPTPYIRIVDAASDTIEFFWTSDPTTLTYPVYDINGVEYTTSTGTPANDINIAPPDSGTKDIEITYKARVKGVDEGAFAGTYTNTAIADAGSLNLYCDGATTESNTCDTSDNFQILSVDAFESAKWVRSNILPVVNVRADRTSYDHASPQFTVNSNFFCTTPIGVDEVLRNDTDRLPINPASDPAITDNNLTGDGVLYSRTPCVAQANPGESFEYIIEITNRGNNQLNEFVFYDILPYINDFGVNESVATRERYSEFEVWLDGAISINISGSTGLSDADFDIQYSTSTDPCRPEMSSGPGINDWQSCGTFVEDYTGTLGSMNRNPRSFRIVQTNNALTLDPDETLLVSIPAYIPTSTDLTNQGLAVVTNEAERAETGEIAWNSFGFRFRSDNTGNLLLAASPRKVGIRVPERLSVGNRVWLDNAGGTDPFTDYDDRERDDVTSTEVGIGDVVLELYRYEGSGSLPNNQGGTDPSSLTDVVLVSRTVTDADGYYLFEEDMRSTSANDGAVTVNGITFPAVTNDTSATTPYPDDQAYDWIGGIDTRSLRPGSYFIYIPPINFSLDYDGNGTPREDAADFGPLFGLASSTGVDTTSGNNADDNRDRGLDEGFDASDIDPKTHGVISDWFDLEFYTSATIESAPSGSNDNPLNEDDVDVPAGETPPTGTGPYGRGTFFQKDEFSDLTRDFGFVTLLSIGNHVWIDNGAISSGSGTDLTEFNDGVWNGNDPDGAEPGVPGVTVNLLREIGGVFTQISSTTTDGTGYYLFDNLSEGNYIVEIPTSNFAGGGPLEGYSSSIDDPTPVDATADENDHGIDVPNPVTGTVRSPEILLEKEGETQADDEAVTGTDGGTDPEIEDEDSDLTVDFGFVRLMSIGNRVWYDTGETSTTFNATNADNGVIDAGELGVPGITVNLLRDIGGVMTQISSTTTDADGYYIFDNLLAGTYQIEIPTSEFGSGRPLEGYFSSTDIATPIDDDADNDDHGIDVADPTSNPVRSPNIVLTELGETQVDDEAVTNTNANTPPVIYDNNSDLTVDLGFIRPMGLGNRVWEDMLRSSTTLLGDGIRQTGENGIGEVQIQLYADDGDGIFEPSADTLLSETTTSGTGLAPGNGYYLFDRMSLFNDRRLGPGDYFVNISSTEFQTGEPLFNYINSNNGNTSGTDTGPDSILDDLTGDENGVDATPGDTSTYPINAGVQSTLIELRYDDEPPANARTENDFDATLAPDFNGENVEDDNGDLTIDFGFYQGLAIGNRVWYDLNRDGQIDATDQNPGNADPTNVGIADVTVYLYRDDGTGSPTGTPLATDVTNEFGYYLFDRDRDGDVLLPDDYVVAIDLSAGNNATSLEDMVNTITRADATETIGATAPDAGVDNDDNGIDQRDLGGTVPTIIYSEVITLSHFDETDAEDAGDKEVLGDDTDPYFSDGVGIPDNNSDLTVDFGFFIPVSIGNRVWFDSDNDALLNNGELGLDNVIVELFRGTTATGTPYRTTVTVTDSTTGEAGYYLFDDLPEGDYVVRLAPENFQPDDGSTVVIDGITVNQFGALTDMFDAPYSSSESGGATESDYLLDPPTSGLLESNDNGIDENFPQINGIVSNPINLTRIQEPDGNGEQDDTDLNNDITSGGVVNEGRFGEQDDNADFTIDFGVYAPLMSIGNLVFYDYDNDRIFNNADEGVDGVIVNLFLDADEDGIPDSGINNPIDTVTTANGGWYLFDGLSAGSYLVQVDENNFRTTGNPPLRDYYSSQDKDEFNVYQDPRWDSVTDPFIYDENDTYESGVDEPFSLARNPDLQAEGVFSPTIRLEPSNEAIDEDSIGGTEPGVGDGEPNIQPSNSDLTVDFGFYQPMSIGNVVWFDTIRNGIFDSTESGIAGVEVHLYRDNGDGMFVIGDEDIVPVFNGTSYDNFDITDSNGYYLFDNLLAGDYFVHIPAANFVSGVLTGHVSTFDEDEPNPGISPAPPSDSNDNGTPNDTTNTTDGVTSDPNNPIRLGTLVTVSGTDFFIPNSSEPVLEVEKSLNPATPASEYDGPASIGRYGEIDANSDITVDFGFILEDDSSMSIGNRVWFDTNHDGLITAGVDDNPVAPGNPGIENVVVLLYRADTSGNPIGTAIARDITNAEGYYLFDVLDTDATTAVGLDPGNGLGGPVGPGNYVVVIPDSNFAGGGPLENYATTYFNVDNTADTPPAGFTDIDDDDNNSNGQDVATLGVVSELVTLILDNERDDEAVADKDPADLDGTDASSNPIAFENSDLTVDFGFYLPMSIGNFVWVDTNNDGSYDPATESPVDDGVIMSLYESDGVTPIEDPDNPGNPYQVTTDDGYYLFDNLPPGDYVVRVDMLNFLSTGILEGYLGSNAGGTFEDNSDGDDNDNGRDVDPTTAGIPSGVITLAYGTEPESETTSGNPADGPNGRGNNGELDNNSNLTVDFGVYPSTYFSIGNRVWQDTGAGTNNDNGIFNSDELGIENVIMYLFRDEAGGGADGTPDTLIPIETTTTDANGYYLFDSLTSGSYIVSVAPENFEASGVLRGFSPSSVAASGADDDTDNTSDHFNTTPDDDFGIYSSPYTLELLPIPEPVSPTESDPTPIGQAQDSGTDPSGTPILDNQSNLTVDFGFVRTLTIGNLVWFDLDQDGRYDDGDEVGISGVTVELYEDTNGNGLFEPGTDPLRNTDITDGNGFYLFNSVSSSNYFVHIPYINWNVSGTDSPLFGYESTIDARAGDSNDDNDNGIGTGDSDPTAGITTEVFNIDFGSAPTGESTVSNNDDDGPEYRGVNNPPDNNSDLTRDFGFFIGNPMSIGNIVWIDDGGTTGTAGDGIRNGDEVGVDDVVVELYRDSDNDGNSDTTSPLATTTTDNGGYYLFDGLTPGSYIVVIAEENFDNTGPLNGFRSTTDGTPDVDDNDNGDNGDPTSGGVSSGTVRLVVGNEPTDPTPADPTNGDDEDSEDVTGTGDNGELDEDSNLTVDFGFLQSFDWGDAPDTYGTNGPLDTISGTNDSAEPGASHRIIANLYLGAGVDDEGDGQPVAPPSSITGTKTPNNTGDPGGDGTDEDGMDFPNFIAGTTVTVDVTAFNDTGDDATLIGWFDWDGDGTFDDDEAYEVDVPDGTDGIVQLEVEIPIDAQDLTGGQTYVRLRLTTDSITVSEPTGSKNSGEVEDYLIDVEDPGLLINKTDGLNSIVAGQTNTYTITIENSGEERIGVRFFDDFQVATDADPNGYDPETIEWECVGTNGALCISNPASGTDGTTSSGGPFDEDATSVVIDELIDLPRDGIVTYTVTARVNSQAGLDGSNTPLLNVAQLPNEDPPLEDDDITFVIYDPPFGVKTGTLLGDDIIRWTMIWYNPGPTQTDVVITDILEDNQEFPPTTAEIDLQCSGSDGACRIDGDDRVVWEGTMFNSTEDDDADAVVISFNVLIDGDGRFENTGTLLFTTTDFTTDADARVTIRDGEEQEDDSEDDPGFSQPPPPLSKTVDTPFTLPGAEVTWTITTTNDTGNTIKNVVITDEVPDSLTIVDVTATKGDLTIDGQTVSLKFDNLFENETVTITLTTTVNDDVDLPFAINNPAVLTCDCDDDSNAIATILSVLELPATGETPWWRMILLLILTGGIGLAGYVGYRRKTQYR